MNFDFPTWWGFVLLGLAAFRTWRIVGEDTIFDRPRERLIREIDSRREFITCPWCAGFWVSLLWWLGWTVSHRWALIIAVPFAISAVVGLIAANIDPVD